MFLDEQTTYKIRRNNRIIEPVAEYLCEDVWMVLNDFDPYEVTDVVIEGKNRTLGIYDTWTIEGNIEHVLSLWADSPTYPNYYYDADTDTKMATGDYYNSDTTLATKTIEDFMSMLSFFDNIESKKRLEAKDLSDGFYICYNPSEKDTKSYFYGSHLFPCHVKDNEITDADGSISKDDENLSEIFFIEIPGFIRLSV